MRAVVLTLALAAAGVAASDRPVSAQVFQTYPYCIFTGGVDGGFERCMYTSFQQCLYDRQAEGGVCYTNPNYFAGPAYRSGDEPLVERPRRRVRAPHG